MEDMYFPFHMMNLIGFGDVAIPTKVGSGIPFEPTSVVPPLGYKNIVFKLKGGGTGFLISVSEIEINGVVNKIGLMLTAAHVILDMHKGNLKSKTLSCKLNDIRETAYVLKEFTSETTVNHICGTTQSLYCLPGDVAVLLVTLNNCGANDFYEPKFSATIGMECFIPGFPRCPPDIKYSIPNRNYSDAELKRLANEIFNNFTGIVFSHGALINYNENLLEVSCSTTNGMSGSPIVSEGRYIGIYVGGPALPGQKELLDAIKFIGSERYAQAFDILSSTTNYDSLYDGPVFSVLLRSYKFQILSLLSKVQRNIDLTNSEKDELMFLNKYPNIKEDNIKAFATNLNLLMYQLVWNYSERQNYIANIGISYRNDIFRKIDAIVRYFLSCSALRFVSIDEFISYIISLI